MKSRRIISQSTTLKGVHPHNRSIMFGRRPATCRSLMDSIPCSPVSMCVCVCARVRSCVCVSVKSRTRNERTFILAFESTAPSVLTLADYKSDSHSCHDSFFFLCLFLTLTATNMAQTISNKPSEHPGPL